MPGSLLIPIENGTGVKTYGVNYNKLYIMRNTLFCFAIIAISVSCAYDELEFYPEQVAEEYALEQLTNYLQKQQRRLQHEPKPEFTFRMPERPNNPVDDIFAVAPPDPRYYQPISDDIYQRDYYTDTDLDLTSNEESGSDFRLRSSQQFKPRSDDPINVVPHLREQGLARLMGPGFHLPAQIHQAIPQEVPQEAVAHREVVGDQLLIEPVRVRPAPTDDTAGVYVIAVVAGISAAATVGLIAFGIGWYNLQKNVKSATDVEYPAYGVTGPNKDVSPSSDRRLAQSAQMYHYQHQKQQIIAMESRTATSDRNGSLSEAESDEENEEGDYTVYECPGLAPTGDMEVKNPLFQDDTTPAAHVTAKTEEPSKHK